MARARHRSSRSRKTSQIAQTNAAKPVKPPRGRAQGIHTHTQGVLNPREVSPNQEEICLEQRHVAIWTPELRFTASMWRHLAQMWLTKLMANGAICLQDRLSAQKGQSACRIGNLP